nr:saccharopine dehydrogenase-like oxidoreductase [Leptinotarsa decemlineata]
MTEDRLDILILGATGFTGLHCIPYVHKLSKANGRNLTWGVAGRSEEKLQEVLKSTGEKIGVDLSNTPMVITDIKSYDSLLLMAKKTKIVINCCGPYQFLGEPVVKACIAAGTHHVDISGEPQYMEKMQLEQHQNAKEKGVYVISACGLDSIPSDLGVIFLKQNFDGVLNSVETYLEVWEEGNNSGAAINVGTWNSAVHSLAQWNELNDIRRKLFPKALPSFNPQLKKKLLPHKSDLVDGWIIPFPGADLPVMERTQRYLYEKESKRPIQVNTYFVVRSIFTVILFALGGAILTILTKFNCGIKLLLNYPEVFSFGMVSKKQPSEEKIENSWFQVTLHGKGWSGPSEKGLNNYTIPYNKSILGRVKGRNPTYGSTCICLVCAAIVVLTESDKMPEEGGVFPPGAAFENTSLITLLKENEVTFDIISEQPILR